MARRDEGAYPQWSVTEEPRSTEEATAIDILNTLLNPIN